MPPVTQDYLRIIRARGVTRTPGALADEEATDADSPFAAYVQSFGTVVRFTVRETEDVVGDLAFLARIRAVLSEYPGQNLIKMRIVTLDGRRPIVGWRALASDDLRIGLARVLAARAAGAS